MATASGVLSNSDKDFPMPDNLRPLLVALAREVLSSQPSDLYTFGALFFHTLIEVRSEVGIDPLVDQQAYAIVRSVLTNETRRLRLDTSKRQNFDHIVNSEIIDDVVNLTHMLATEEKAKNVSATKIQAGIRGYLTRKHLEKEGIKVVPTSAMERSLRQRSQSVDTTATHGKGFQPEKAAVMIQAAVRSYLTRKHLEQEGIHFPTKKM